MKTRVSLRLSFSVPLLSMFAFVHCFYYISLFGLPFCKYFALGLFCNVFVVLLMAFPTFVLSWLFLSCMSMAFTFMVQIESANEFALVLGCYDRSNV